MSEAKGEAKEIAREAKDIARGLRETTAEFIRLCADDRYVIVEPTDIAYKEATAKKLFRYGDGLTPLGRAVARELEPSHE